MKKILLLILLLNLIYMPVFSAQIYKSGSLYGLKSDNGNVVLTAQYQGIEQFSYTPSKKVIIPMHAMDEVCDKKLNLYKLKKNNLYGVSNSNGRIIHECKYRNIEPDSNGDLKFTLPDGTIEYAHPIINASKSLRDTAVTIVGLPVTILGAVMIPIEAVSKGVRSK